MNVPYNPNDSTAEGAVLAVIRYENTRGNRPDRSRVDRMTPHYADYEVETAVDRLQASGEIFASTAGYVVVDTDVLDDLFDRDEDLDRALGLNGHTRDDRRTL